MRVRSREINVVSMSALDLFCCALGAFIALALIALPYFPNQSSKEVQDALAKAQAQTQALAAQNTQLKAEKGLKAEAVDVVIVIDSTGSMDKTIDGLKYEIQDFVGVIGSLSDHARVGIIEYKDRCEMPTPNFSGMKPASKGGNLELTTFAKNLKAGSIACNQDLPENLYDAVLMAERIQWEAPEHNRYIIAIGDEPPYPEVMSALLREADAFGKRGGHLSTMYAPSDSPDSTVADYYKQLAQSGNGTASTNGGSFGMALLKSIAN